ncbi:MAG: class I SAM-dependent methyltransferase [Rhodoferax sp.]|uniref:class I SAM-dependent methyltransferase n=1 Tax=Rhodoferax sp. TaxID=50421 RepID=UPI003BB04D12
MFDYTGTDNLELMVEAVNYNAFLLALVRNEVGPGQSVLDFGAGIGTFASALAQHGVAVRCVEPDPRQRERIKAAGMVAHADLDGLADGCIDLLYSLNVLEHIEDDMAVLRQWHNKVKPGGRVLIYVPAFQLLYSSMDRMVGHCRRYTRGELSDKVQQAGFVVLRNEYVDSVGFLASLLFKAFGSDDGSINRQALIAYDRYVFPLSRLMDKSFKHLLGKNVLMVAQRR